MDRIETDGDCRSMNQVLLSKLAAEPNTPFPFGTVQAEIPESSPAAVAISSMQGEIAEEDLAGRGRDIGPPHVTLRYGIQGDAVSAIKALLMTQRPFAITLCPTSSFPTSATREVVVMIATIECPELHAPHQQLGAVVDFATDPSIRAACHGRVRKAGGRGEICRQSDHRWPYLRHHGSGHPHTVEGRNDRRAERVGQDRERPDLRPHGVGIIEHLRERSPGGVMWGIFATLCFGPWIL